MMRRTSSADYTVLEFHTTELLVPSWKHELETIASSAVTRDDGARAMNQSTSRRDFLATSALIAAGLALGPSHASSNQPGEDKGTRKEGNNMKTRKLGE